THSGEGLDRLIPGVVAQVLVDHALEQCDLAVVALDQVAQGLDAVRETLPLQRRRPRRESRSGICCPVPERTSASGQSVTSRRRIASAGSTATTPSNTETSRRVSLPVPAPTSSTVAAGGRRGSSTV